MTKPATAPQAHRRSQRGTMNLSQSGQQTLEALQARCSQLGIKIKREKLLAIAMRLLADAPTGKLLAILGPHESIKKPVKLRKKKAPTRT